MCTKVELIISINITYACFLHVFLCCKDLQKMVSAIGGSTGQQQPDSADGSSGDLVIRLASFHNLLFCISIPKALGNKHLKQTT